MSHVSALQFYGGRCLPKGPRSRPALAPARQHCRPCERELLSATPPRLSVPSVELVAPWRKSETLRRGCVLGLLPKCSTVLLPSSGSFRMSSLGRAGPWWPERRRKPRGGGAAGPALPCGEPGLLFSCRGSFRVLSSVALGCQPRDPMGSGHAD